ncbi:hypothetical protein C8R47DRAFT_1153492 [Mycena vitilis]|nr:hypothetical protein C8R47DRAFT_1153492 [Mycena vitilis]
MARDGTDRKKEKKKDKKSDKKEKKEKKEKKKKKQATDRRPFYVVSEEADGSLVCTCPAFKATGKTCVEIAGARLYREFGPAERYKNPEPEKGKKKVGQSSKKVKKDKAPPRLPDHVIDKEYETFLQRLEEDPDWNPFPSTGSTREKTQTGPSGTTVSRGRPPAIAPLHPGRSPTKSPVKFSGKPGPKPHAYNSLLASLPGKSPKKTATKTAHQGSPESSSSSSDSGSDSDEHGELPWAPLPAPDYSSKGKGKAKISPTPEPSGATVEDVQIMDVNFSHWSATPNYKLRQDEELEVCELLNAVAVGMRNGVLVLGDSYAFDANKLRDVVWTASDDEPINARGAPAFAKETVLQKAWLHSQAITLDTLLVFHNDRVRDHWLLFQGSLGKKKRVVCYEPLSSHGQQLDIQDINLFVSYFSQQRPSEPATRKPNFDYRARTLNIQRDGYSCGFWMITLALLIVCNVAIDEECIDCLDAIGIDTLQYHWKCILTSWRIEEHGLGYLPLNNILAYWNLEFGPDSSDQHPECVAHRPAWISRFDPTQVDRELANLRSPGYNGKIEPAASKNIASGSVPKIKVPAEPTRAERMVSIQRRIKRLQDTNTEVLCFGKQQITLEHLNKRILKSAMADDEIINMLIAIYSHGTESSAPNPIDHFAAHFQLQKPTRDFKILSSFFLPKLFDAVKQSNSPQGLTEPHAKRLLRWFKKVNLNQLNRLFIPINFPAGVHWFLLVVYFGTKHVIIYDSWSQNRQDCEDSDQSIASTPYHQVLAVLVALLKLLYKATDGKLTDLDPTWVIQALPVPSQTNGVDCGFFMIMFLLHLLYFDEVNGKDCPPSLKISAQNMPDIRLTLADCLIEWCSTSTSPVSLPTVTAATPSAASPTQIVTSRDPKSENASNADSEMPNANSEMEMKEDVSHEIVAAGTTPSKGVGSRELLPTDKKFEDLTDPTYVIPAQAHAAVEIKNEPLEMGIDLKTKPHEKTIIDLTDPTYVNPPQVHTEIKIKDEPLEIGVNFDIQQPGTNNTGPRDQLPAQVSDNRHPSPSPVPTSDAEEEELPKVQAQSRQSSPMTPLSSSSPLPVAQDAKRRNPTRRGRPKC